MHKIISTIFLILFYAVSLYCQNQHFGIWKAKEEAGISICYELTQDNRIITIKIQGKDTVFTNEFIYKIDYSKKPVWLDWIKPGGETETRIVGKFLLEIVTDNEMILQSSNNPLVRPDKMSIEDKENFKM
jgi:hypothetical protein